MNAAKVYRATLRVQYIEATIGARGDVRRVFREVEKWGGTATYREHPALFSTTYTNVVMTGPARVIQWAHQTLESMFSD